jgi:N4-gp56 family major capsid protein
MALWFPASNAEVVQIWEKELDVEVRAKGPLLEPEYGFSGTGMNKLITIKDELTNGTGKSITYKLRYQLDGRGRAGDETLKGFGEGYQIATDSVTVHVLRHMVETSSPMMDQYVYEDTLEEGKDGLGDWFQTRMEFALNLHAAGFDLVTDKAYNLHNTIVDIADNYIIRPGGASAGGLTSGDKFDLDLLSDVARQVKLLRPKLRPASTPVGDRFCLFLAPEQVRSLRDTESIWFQTMQNALKGSVVDDNPLLSTALGQWNGFIIFESDLIPPGIDSTGAKIQNKTRRAWVGGAQALALAFGRGRAPEGHKLNRYRWIRETEDFEHVGQVAASTIVGAKRPRYTHPDESTAREAGVVCIETWADFGSLTNTDVYADWIQAGGGLEIAT